MKLPIYNKNGDLKCHAIIDRDDLERINLYTWRLAGTGYIKGKIDKKDVYLHRYVMKELNSSVVIDHVNNNILDNRKVNLRQATLQSNSFNRIKSKNKSSHYKGVSFEKSKDKWQSYIKVDQKKYFLGYHDNQIEAAELYDINAIRIFKNFALLNFPNKKYTNIENRGVIKKSKFGDPNYELLIRKK